MSNQTIHLSSFRDPSGFLFYEGNNLYRQINKSYQEDYDYFIETGLYEKLCQKNLLVSHEELENHKGLHENAYRVIKPEVIHFISHPYEWSFSQLKDAALTTLKIQQTALNKGMTLKDASAYNIQFHEGKPIFIDTLSFEKYEEGKPWVAYKQFCQHFLAPLSLMSHTDIRLNQLLKVYLDGIPLDLTSKLLPFKTKWSFSLLMHIHLHANAQRKYENKGTAAKNIEISKAKSLAIIQSLINTISKLKIKSQKTEWGDYYNFTNYSDNSFANKKNIIKNFIEELKPDFLWDLGANTGEFTQIASELGVKCIAFDIDPLAVEANYNLIKKQGNKNILPLIMDLTNPSPSIGWSNEERQGFKLRKLPDTILALALIHHLAISNNLTFNKIAKFFSELSENLIIEFVPKSDSQVKKLLESRKDIFEGYNEESFVKEFSEFFHISTKENVIDSQRTIYKMKRK